MAGRLDTVIPATTIPATTIPATTTPATTILGHQTRRLYSY